MKLAMFDATERRLLLILILLAFVGGCANVDNQAAKFKQSQKLRQQALVAARDGDTATALADLDRVQVLEPLNQRSPGLPPPSMNGPEHRAIAPASGTVTCNNIGINRFSCF